MILQVGVKAFLSDGKGKFLLLHRSLQKYPGTKGSWDIVGGRIDPGSKLLDNLQREIKEETQLSLTSEPQLIYAQDIIPNTEKHVVRLTYIAQTQGDPTLDVSENDAYKWLTVDELKKHEDVDVYVKEILDRGILDSYK